MHTKIYFTVLVLITSMAWTKPRRGGWISSGGEIFLYDKNPWFVKNTTNVRFCLQVDQESVSIPSEKIRESFFQALDFWKRELLLENSVSAPGVVSIGTQNFQEVPCSEMHDLGVKVGFGALSEDEVVYLTRPEGEGAAAKDIRSYIGVSIRKSYDFVNMRGQGILFIASDRGPYAYENHGQLIEKAWSQPQLLQYAFMHELGHILGFPHTGTGLMSEVFLEQVISQRLAGFFSSKPVQGFLKYPETFEVCTLSGTFRPQFFQIRDGVECLVIQDNSKPEGGEQVFQVGVRGQSINTVDWIGSFHMHSDLSSLRGLTYGVTVQLPPEQVVFGSKDLGFATFLIGGLSREMTMEGAFRLKGSMRPYPVFANFTKDRIGFYAVENGKIVNVLSYSPPNLMKVLVGF